MLMVFIYTLHRTARIKARLHFFMASHSVAHFQTPAASVSQPNHLNHLCIMMAPVFNYLEKKQKVRSFIGVEKKKLDCLLGFYTH